MLHANRTLSAISTDVNPLVSKPVFSLIINSGRPLAGVEIINKDPNGLERFRMGATLTFGWNTFNFHVYYSLNDLFDESVEVIDQNGALQIIKVGLMFYIL